MALVNTSQIRKDITYKQYMNIAFANKHHPCICRSRESICRSLYCLHVYNNVSSYSNTGCNIKTYCVSESEILNFMNLVYVQIMLI